MPLSLEDIEAALLQGQADYMEFMRSVEQDIMGATEKRQAMVVWNSLPGHIKETMKRMDPKAYAEAEKFIGSAGE